MSVSGSGKVRRGADASRTVSPGRGGETHLNWGRRNYVILAAGGGSVVLGFILLALGDKSIAPVLLVGGYLGLIPWGILARPSRGID